MTEKKITGRLWFDNHEGWWVIEDCDPPSWVGGRMRYYVDVLADFLSTFVKSGQAFEVTISPKDILKNKEYWDGVVKDKEKKKK